MGRIGTVAAVIDVDAAGGFAARADAIVRIEWDGSAGPPVTASADEVYAIRPPPVLSPAPSPWPAPAF